VLTEHYGADKIAEDEVRDVDDFLDFVLNELQQGNKSQITSRDIREDNANKLFIIDDAVAFILAGRSAFSRYFDWAQLLTRYRTAIARQYRRLYETSRFQLALATPALVDFDLWLNDSKHAALKQQAEVMSIISAKSDFPLHPFAPFDPLRDIQAGADAGSSLALVQAAVREQGFIGVKLYSPMGFRPRGNGVRPITFPKHLDRVDTGFGDRLDAALDALYTWCRSDEVPIMAHTLNSQESKPGFALRADPKFWRDVLTEFPDLRLNLAHFGNFSFAFSAGGTPEANFDKSWEYEIGQFVSSGSFPNVFADISYFGFALGPEAESRSAVESAKRLFSLYISKFDPEVKSLMFGTDWSMIARAAHFEQYLTNVDGFFRGIGLTAGQIDNIFYGNAVRFLGLEQDGKARQRLRAFYQKAGRFLPSF
jgi:predicted TIM-barrel fold metal-dependent hydrolase